ncbi:MAG TPA: hypothetical protein VFN56_03645 [Candidatus Saccharimonadales bacterium]|nr:hypothetical protein [Candidatus Saccharimonadales bacterium]
MEEDKSRRMNSLISLTLNDTATFLHDLQCGEQNVDVLWCAIAVDDVNIPLVLSIATNIAIVHANPALKFAIIKGYLMWDVLEERRKAKQEIRALWFSGTQ